MSNHFLTRNPDNDPVCSCGYRPDILDDFRPWGGRRGKAKAAVLEHADAMADNVVRFAEVVLGEPITTWQGQVLRQALRSPDVPFRLPERAKFPRAGVRQTEDGRWLLSCWDADRVVHVIDEPIFDERVKAFDYGYLTIGACRESGTNLNGWPAE